jgi:hypothetical protein
MRVSACTAGSIKNLVADWDVELDAAASRSTYRGTRGRKPAKLVHNIVLSMPAETSPTGLLAASRAFAREQFALKNRYAMVLHTDEGHPHVHLVVKAMSDHGQRLNIIKATLRDWRQEFARHLREQGIVANATERVIRGVTEPRKLDAIRRAMRDGRSSHLLQRARSVARAVLARDLPVEPGKAKLLKTRASVVHGWRAVSQALRLDGRSDLAMEVDRFLQQMPPPRTEREWIASQLFSRVRPPPTKEPPLTR